MAWERDSKPIITIATPVSGSISPSWANKIREMHLPRWTWYLRGGGALPIDIARNLLVKDALEDGSQYILFLDSDVLPPLDGVLHLMAWKLPIVSGLYWVRKEEGECWAMWKDEGGYKMRAIKAWDGRLLKVDIVGLGFMLVDMRVFKKIPPPWFKFQLVSGLKPGEKEIFLGEDVFFCRLARKHGFPIHVDTFVRCEHIQTMKFSKTGQVKPSL